MMMGRWEVAEREWRKGPWTPEEDKLLVEYVNCYGEGRWSSVSKCAGLNRSGKSCRLRWVNYLRPGLKKGHITPQEEGIIIELHALWGNKWSTIARYLPGRTDNEIKNYWRTHFKKRKPSPDNDHDHHGKTKAQRHNNQEQETKKDEKVSDVEECYDDGAQGKKREKANHHDQVFMQDYNNNTCFWADLVQDDGESFMSFNGRLWELDDQNGCSKMAIQNQGGVANYSRSGGGGGGGGGDGVMNYMFSGDYIF